MKKQYSIVDNKKKKYVKECFFDVLDIEDCRVPVDNGSTFSGENILLTHEISNGFLEQLTEQISGKIFKVLNRKKDKRSYLALRSRYIIEIDNVKYFWATLFWNNTIGHVDLWLKVWSKNGPVEFTDNSNLIFEICDRKESQMCDKNFSGATYRYWEDQINIYFDLFDKKAQNKSEKTHPSSYPDVIINCHFDKLVTNTLKQRVCIFLNNYISNFNCNLQNEYEIHDFFLVDNPSKKVISISIDFGNCEPDTLVELLQHLSKSNLGIIDFSFN